MKGKTSILNYFIALIWLINGLFCKVLNLVPRHEVIVARILDLEFSRPMTVLIGISEIAMSAWILSGYRSRLNAVIQILVVASMNLLEFILVPELLLWGKYNSLFALIFILIVFYSEFVIGKKNRILSL